MANNDNQPTKNNNPDLALYYLLHKNPIYKYVKGQENIHIMILGAGDWAMRFIGIALQTCQVVGRTVTITVACDDPENTAKDYLRIRPAVPEFVTIKLFDMNGLFRIVKGLNEDGKLDFANESLEKKEMYGTLNFVTCSFKNAEREDAVVINNLVTKFGKPQYVFIDLAQNDTYNYDIAKAFKNVVRDIDSAQDDFGFINFVVKNENVTDEFTGFNPVFVSQVISVTDKDPLDQMAFNAHLSWYNTLNIDQIAEREKFKEDTYNYNSSLAFVLSIPYKLWSVGIINTDDDVAQKTEITLADEFQEILDSNESGKREKYLKLIQLEHRRWVLEKICDVEQLTQDGKAIGWQAPKKIDEEFVNGCIKRWSVKDKKEKIHQCILRSTIEMPLKGDHYSKEPHDGKEPYAGWNIEDVDYDSKLDELDCMSVELHRMFYKEAQEIIEKKELESTISILEMLLYGERKDVLRAFERYRYYIKNILGGNETYSKQFESEQKAFIKALIGIAPKKRMQIIGGNEQKMGGLLKDIADKLFPVIESNLYRDYKSLDEELVKNIPFILTYKQVKELALAFDDDRQGNGKNNAIFQNVASATVLNPQIITFLYHYDKYTREELLVSKIRAVVSYLKKRIEGCKINFIIAFQNPTHTAKAYIEKFVKKIDGANIVTQECSNDEEAIAFFRSQLSKGTIYDGTTNVFKSGLSSGKLRLEIYDHIPYFQFEEFQDKHFTECNHCDFLKYIEKGTVINKTYLRIEDMFALMNAQNTTYKLPEFSDKYDKIWDVYIGKEGETLKRIVPDKGNKRWECAVRNWNLLCGHLEKRVKNIKLQEKVVIEFDFSEKEKAKKITEGKFAVENEDFYKEYIDILEKMKENKFIKDLCVLKTTPYNKSEVSFLFTTEKAKKLMCTSGEILEIFTYFEALKTGYFDDIACSYVFRWDAVKVNNETDELNVENELDCILTKGFKTIIVECKAVESLEQDFYQKLDSLTNQFGIAEKAVILANTYDQRKKYKNNLMRKRGKLMNIITISDPENIKQIGKNLVDIMEGKKSGKDFEVKKGGKGNV